MHARRLLAHSMNGEVNLVSLLEGLGRPLRDWLSDAAEGRGLRRGELVRARRGDRERWLQITLEREHSGEDVVLCAVLLDATELRSLQAQFTQGQKMQAIGQLAGGVAHDFNNLLTAISGHCDLLLLRRDEGDPDFADLQQIHQNANRAASLVSQLLAFSRKQTLRPRILDLRETISDLTHLLQRLTGERVRLTFLHDHDLAPVRADPRQIEQVIMNLVVNARDAIGGAGDIRIETRNLVLEGQIERDRAVVPAGSYVQVTGADTGCGIPPERLAKVFEPFFTTKRHGEGTGLGLSTAYGIVKQSGGFIFADSRPGEGSAFHIYLPATRALPPRPRVAPPGVGGKAGLTPRVTGRILLVEDEAPVRAFAARALRLCGHEVLEADSGERALELLADPEVMADLFVTDVVMPGLGGPEWVRAARRTRPGIPVIFISGYAEESAGIPDEDRQEADFLPKPFSLLALTERVAARLAAACPDMQAGRKTDAD
ncbi:MAG: response regulator [Rhodobacteraceae bacterium]|nr:response regulator [Paracoccaceae bacterium]